MNIGYDDLFCIVLFLAVFIRRNMMGGIPIRLGYSFWVITGFLGMVAIAAFSGYTNFSYVGLAPYLKEILKMGVFWCLFYAIMHCVDDEHDLKIQFSMFSLAAVIGAGIVIFQYFAPSLAWPWQLPEDSFLGVRTVGTIGADVEDKRAYGAFMNANCAACILAASLILVLGAIRFYKSVLFKLFTFILCIVLLIALLMTKSRSGFMMLGMTMVLMAFFGRNRKIPWIVLAAGVLVFVLFADIRTAFLARVSDIYNPESKEVSGNVVGRVEIWKQYFETADMKTFVFGQGVISGMIRNETESHSMYVALPTVYGLGGMVWAVASLIGFIKRVRYTKYFGNPFLGQVATACLWTLFAFSLYGATSDAISSNYPRYLLLYLAVLIDRSCAIAREGYLSAGMAVLDGYSGEEEISYESTV
ncbi:MAG: O-antigen ligase family protein [Phycisphaerae bacterium]|nr:O-antigen ligase family protein [Phycisphaerae bacterium]